MYPLTGGRSCRGLTKKDGFSADFAVLCAGKPYQLWLCCSRFPNDIEKMLTVAVELGLTDAIDGQ